MSGIIKKIEDAMHHGKKEGKEIKEDEIPKFGSGHIEKASGGFYDAGADLHSKPVHDPDARPGSAIYEDDEKKKGKHTADGETGAGRSDEHLKGVQAGAYGNSAMPSTKEKEHISTTSTGQANNTRGLSSNTTSQVHNEFIPTTIGSGYTTGSSAPVGEVLPGPANISEIREEVESAFDATSTATGNTTTSIGRV